MKVKILNSKNHQLTQSQIKTISQTTRSQPSLSYRPLPIIKKSIHQGNFLLAFNSSDRLIGWIERYHIHNDWWGISTLYVLPQFRDRGVGRKSLLPQMVKSLQDKHVFAATKNSQIKPILHAYNFSQKRLIQFPLIVIAKILFLRYSAPNTWPKLVRFTQNHLAYYHRPPNQ